MTEKIPENEAIMGKYKGIARTIASNGEERYYGEDLETGKKTVRLPVKYLEEVEDAFHLKKLEKKYGTYEKHKAAHQHEQTAPETSSDDEWVTDPQGNKWQRVPNPGRRLIKLIRVDDRGEDRTFIVEPETYESWKESSQSVEKYTAYTNPKEALRTRKRIAPYEIVTVIGEYEMPEGEIWCKLGNVPVSEERVPKSELRFFAEDSGEGVDTQGYPRKGDWKPQNEELQKGTTIHGQRESDGWYDVEGEQEIGGLKRRWVPPEEVTLEEFYQKSDLDALEADFEQKMADLESRLREEFEKRLEEVEKKHQEDLKAKNEEIAELKRQLEEAKASPAEPAPPEPATPTAPAPGPAPESIPDPEKKKQANNEPKVGDQAFYKVDGVTQFFWRVHERQVEEREGGKKVVIIVNTHDLHSIAEVPYEEFMAWRAEQAANYKGMIWDRVKKTKDGQRKSRDWFGWLKKRKDEEDDSKNSRRRRALGTMGTGLAIGALAGLAAFGIIDEISEDDGGQTTNNYYQTTNNIQNQNTSTPGEGQMGPYKVRIMPNPAPRQGTTTPETQTTPAAPTTTTETAPPAPTTTEETEPAPSTTTTEAVPPTTTTPDTAPQAPPTTETQTTPASPPASTETTPSGSSGQTAPSAGQLSEAQLHGMHLEHYNLENGHGFVEVNLPQELNLIQPQEGGPYFITNAAGEPIVENVRYTTTGLLDEASSEALRSNGYKVDYQRNAVFDNGQEVQNYMSVITQAG